MCMILVNPKFSTTFFYSRIGELVAFPVQDLLFHHQPSMAAVIEA
jgi:hypothetical protein